LQRLQDYTDEQVDRAVHAKFKGALVAYRDASINRPGLGRDLRRCGGSVAYVDGQRGVAGIEPVEADRT